MWRRFLCRLGFHAENAATREWLWSEWRSRYHCRHCGKPFLGPVHYR